MVKPYLKAHHSSQRMVMATTKKSLHCLPPFVSQERKRNVIEFAGELLVYFQWWIQEALGVRPPMPRRFLQNHAVFRQF